ncbi:MAG TPA: hypothetical protein VIR57_20065 [Chloroflexota bacterium]|jgi:hypothetical protein
MARIHALTREEAPEEVRPIYDANIKSWGQVSNTTGIWAYRPPIQKGVQALGRGISESGLISEKLRCLINVRIASQVGCGF